MREQQSLAKLGPASVSTAARGGPPFFIVTLDDIPEGKRNAYAISLAEDLDTSGPETLDPESTPTEDTVLPWGHVVTRNVEAGPMGSVQIPRNPARDPESG